LEIEDIGVINDRAHNIKECHAYETYAMPRRGYNVY
jgi:hypothetical protein